jgi:hypothetical protein
MFYLNADVTAPGKPNLPSVLAHEFQHMIAWHRHRNENAWMNEGSSVLAELINGYTPDGFDSSFLDQPDTQLDAWSEGGPGIDTAPHYGAGFVFADGQPVAADVRRAGHPPGSDQRRHHPRADGIGRQQQREPETGLEKRRESHPGRLGDALFTTQVANCQFDVK